MTQNVSGLVHGQPVPTQFFTATQEMLGSHVSSNFVLRATSATAIGITAGAGDDQVTAAIQGRYRFITAPITRTVTGSAGTYDIFITASDNVMADPDTTVYAFALAVVATGGTPGGVAVYRKIGSLVWSGTAITSLLQSVGVGARVPRPWMSMCKNRIGFSTPTSGTAPRFPDGLGGAGVISAWTLTAPMPELFRYSAADEIAGMNSEWRFSVKWLFNTSPYTGAPSAFNMPLGMVKLTPPLTVNTFAQVNAPSQSPGPASYAVGTGTVSFPVSPNGTVQGFDFPLSAPAWVDGAIYAWCLTLPGAPVTNGFMAWELDLQRRYVPA